MTKINVKGTVVELLGDEMTRVIWDMLKEDLIFPYLDLNMKVYDLGIENRDKTDDKITQDAAHAIKEHGVGIKCATITPDEARVKEFGLKEMWKSPNGTLRNIIGGTIFREPIACDSLKKYIPSYSKTMVIARHAYADQYMATDKKVNSAGKWKMRFEPADGSDAQEWLAADLKDDCSVGMIMFNKKSSIESFARDSMSYALVRKMDLYLTTKNTILKSYDGLFKDTFQEIYEKEFKDQFDKVGISYEHRLIDDMIAMAIRSEGGFIWSCKNYDGDVQSDFSAQAYHGLGMMTSMLLSDGGNVVETEAAHGTVTRHYRNHQKGQETSTNPVASIFAWTRGLWFRGKIDGNEQLMKFTENLEKACLNTIDSGCITKDLVFLHKTAKEYLNTKEFIKAIKKELDKLIAAQ